MVLQISTCMIFSENKILLIKRNKAPYKDWYAFPGGKVEKHESTMNAVIREIMEETGLSVNPSIYCSLYEDLVENSKILISFELYYYYEFIDKTEIISSEEGELEWYSIDEMPINIVPSDARVLELFRKDREPIKARCQLEQIETSGLKYRLINWEFRGEYNVIKD